MPKIVPRKHQKDGLAKISSARKSGQDTALVVMAPGLGKTYTAALDFQIFQKTHPESRMLFLAHQNEILEQARESFQNIFGESLTYGMFNGQVKDIHGDSVFATFQSMNTELFKTRREKKRRHFGPKRFDYIIVDESHHSQARTYRCVIDFFRPKFLLGITATPDRMDMQEIRDIYGPEVYSHDLEKAMIDGLLTPVEYYLMADEIVDMGEIEVPPHLITIKKLNKIFFSQKRDKEIVKSIHKKVREVKYPRIIVFCPSIKYTEEFAKLMPGSIAIHSRLSYAEQNERMSLIRNGFVTTAITVDKFNEGIDIPEANIIVFLRSTQSATVFYHQLGRGLRKIPGKDTVIVLDFVANCERLKEIDRLRRNMLDHICQRRGINAQKPVISVDWGKVVFEERAQQVLDILQRIKYGLTNENLIEYLKKLRDQLGRVPKLKDMDKAEGFPSDFIFKNRFGSWNNALKAAGMDLYTIHYTDEELIEKLRELKKKLGRTPSNTDMTMAEGFPHCYTYHRRFGNWNKALKASGMNPKSRYSRKRLILHLKKLKRKLKRTPTSIDLIKVKGPSITLYQRRFGTWNNALKAAGMKPNLIIRRLKKK